MRTIILRALLGLLMITLVVPAGELRALAASPSRAGSQEQKKPEEQQKQQPPGGYAITVEVPVVNLDVVITDNNGNYVTGLSKENFRVLDNGVAQKVTNFSSTDAPITIVMLLEFSRRGYYFYAENAINWGDEFLRQLKPNDWVALVWFDMRTHIAVDFTHNTQEVRQELASMVLPSFSESNLFDAVIETVDRLKDVKGKKSILILASGVDTFSKHTLDQTMKELRQTDVTIFSVGIGQQLFEYMDSRGYLGGIGRMNYYQAQNQMSSFAAMTGGRAWFPQFEGQIPSIFQDVAASLRNQYSLAFTPQQLDGKYHKLKVELVDKAGTPLVFKNQKGKKVKFVVYSREGYIAQKVGEGN